VIFFADASMLGKRARNESNVRRPPVTPLFLVIMRNSCLSTREEPTDHNRIICLMSATDFGDESTDRDLQEIHSCDECNCELKPLAAKAEVIATLAKHFE
jgi:hypothetical protein